MTASVSTNSILRLDTSSSRKAVQTKGVLGKLYILAIPTHYHINSTTRLGTGYSALASSMAIPFGIVLLFGKPI